MVSEISNYYIAWVTQNGEGCDYTIGCGQTLWGLEAQTPQEAEAEIKERVVKRVCWEWSERYKSITVYRVSLLCEVDVAGLYRDEEKRLAALAAREIEQAEKALYEKLKDKYAQGGANGL